MEKYVYVGIIKCEDVIKNDKGEVVELRCTYDPDTRSGTGTSKKKVKGTIHWVSAKHAFEAEVRLYDRLFTVESPDSDKEKSFLDFMNPNSLEIIPTALIEPFIKDSKKGDRFQFERHGYFCVDTKYTILETGQPAPSLRGVPPKLVFNRTVTLKDSWGKNNL